MTQKEKEKNIRRINNLNWQLIKTFGFERLAIITSEYNESLVRKLIARGQSLKEQEIIYGHVRTTYEKWRKETALITGPVHFPAYFKDIITDLDCKIPIKGEEEIDASEESIEEYMAKHAMTKEDIDKAISDAESNTVPDEKSSETIAALEARIKELEEENERLKKQPTVDNTDEEFVEKKWISCFDTFLDSRLNAEAIAEKLHEIASPHLPKTKRSFWWVVFTVFSEIHWIPNTSTNRKTILQWANLHFDCGWDWRKDNQFKFSDIQAKIKTKKSSEWNKSLTGNVIGDYYGELAQNIKEVFVEIIDGRIIDRGCFILPGNQRINNGR